MNLKELCKIIFIFRRNFYSLYIVACLALRSFYNEKQTWKNMNICDFQNILWLYYSISLNSPKPINMKCLFGRAEPRKFNALFTHIIEFGFDFL